MKNLKQFIIESQNNNYSKKYILTDETKVNK